MAAQLIFWLNLDADLELEAPERYRRSPALRPRLAAFLSMLAPLRGPGDGWIDPWAPAPLPAPPRDDHHIVPFCPTPSALHGLGQLCLEPPAAPPLAVLRRVNHRAFSMALGSALEGATYVTDLGALRHAVSRRELARTFVIKRPHSFAGRDRRLCHDGALDASTLGFCQNAFARGEGLCVEPWVERLADFALHGYVRPGGEVLLGDPLGLRCDALGRFLGPIPCESSPATELSPGEHERFEREGRAVGAALAAAGYFGPFGIDGFRYRERDGQPAFLPRCEINARLTMTYPRALLLRAIDTRMDEGPGGLGLTPGRS